MMQIWTQQLMELLLASSDHLVKPVSVCEASFFDVFLLTASTQAQIGC